MRSALSLLREAPDFRRLYLARTSSLLGDWFNLLAILALIREIGATGAGPVGVVLILKLLPAAIAGPFAGVLADRLPRKLIMLTADAARCGLVLCLLVTPLMPGRLGLLAVYVLTALQITGQAFSEPARLASVPNVVARSRLTDANVLTAFTWSLMFTAGAGLGGVVTSLLGWRTALLIDAGSYVVSMALIARLRLPPPPSHGVALDPWTLSGLADLRKVVAFLRRRRAVAVLLIAKSGWGLAGGITLLLTLYGERIYPVAGSPALGIAVLYMARGVGTGLGPVLARRLAGDRGRAMRRAVAAGFALAAACYVAFSLVSNVVPAALLVVTAHLGGATVWVFSTVMLQRTVPDRFRGRVFALDMALATAAISAATWASGRLIDRGLVPLEAMPLTVSGALALSGAAWWLATRRRGTDAPRSGLD